MICCTSNRILAEKIAIAITETARYNAGSCRKILAAAAIRSTTTPANSHFTSPEKSRMDTCLIYPSPRQQDTTPAVAGKYWPLLRSGVRPRLQTAIFQARKSRAWTPVSYTHHRDSKIQRRQLQENIGRCCDQEYDHACKQPFSKPGKVALGHRRHAGHDRKHCGGAAERRHDQSCAVGKTEHMAAQAR